jgi:hypothetical protein
MQYPPQGPYGQYPQGQYPQQPYQGQPGYGYPGGYPQPPKKSGGMGLILGLLGAGVLFVLLAVGGYLYARAAKAERIEAQCADRGPSSDCVTLGRCALNDDGTGCIAVKESDCRASKLCKDNGRCGFAYHECKATSEADCRASTECSISGKCDLYLGECRPSSNGHCSMSSLCLKNNHYCYYDPESHNCTQEASTSSSSSSSSGGTTTTYTCPSGYRYVGNGRCRRSL